MKNLIYSALIKDIIAILFFTIFATTIVIVSSYGLFKLGGYLNYKLDLKERIIETIENRVKRECLK